MCQCAAIHDEGPHSIVCRVAQNVKLRHKNYDVIIHEYDVISGNYTTERANVTVTHKTERAIQMSPHITERRLQPADVTKEIFIDNRSYLEYGSIVSRSFT